MIEMAVVSPVATTRFLGSPLRICWAPLITLTVLKQGAVEVAIETIRLVVEMVVRLNFSGFEPTPRRNADMI